MNPPSSKLPGSRLQYPREPKNAWTTSTAWPPGRCWPTISERGRSPHLARWPNAPAWACRPCATTSGADAGACQSNFSSSGGLPRVLPTVAWRRPRGREWRACWCGRNLARCRARACRRHRCGRRRGGSVHRLVGAPTRSAVHDLRGHTVCLLRSLERSSCSDSPD